MKKDLGLHIGKIAGILMVVGAIGAGYGLFTGCQVPPTCENGQFLIPFAGMFFAGVVLLFLGTWINKKESIKKERL